MLWFPFKISSCIRWPSQAAARPFLYGIILGFSLSLTSASLISYYKSRKKLPSKLNFTERPIELRSDEVVSGVTGLIGMFIRTNHTYYLLFDRKGNTPLVRINSLSNALGVEILGKAEVGRKPGMIQSV